MWTSDDLVFAEPVLRERSQEPERRHCLLTVEYVVDYTFKVKPGNNNKYKVTFIYITSCSQRCYPLFLLSLYINNRE